MNVVYQINDIHSRNKLPILCGGTSYYIESILWEYLTSTAGNTDDESLLRSKPEANEIRHVSFLSFYYINSV